MIVFFPCTIERSEDTNLCRVLFVFFPNFCAKFVIAICIVIFSSSINIDLLIGMQLPLSNFKSVKMARKSVNEF